MINGASTRRLFESFCSGASNHQGHSGPLGFVRLTKDLLGLTRDSYGRPALRETLDDGKRRLRPDEFSLRDLAESLVGPDWVCALDPRQGSPYGGVDLLEGANVAVQPSAFNHISAFNATVGGLLEVKVLEAYRKPGFIADQLVRTIATRQRSEKLPATSRIGDKAETMNPGQAHPRAQFGERYVTTPETQKRGLAVDVTKEAVFFDLTNEMLMRAESIGEELGLRKEKLVLDMVLGVTNTYTYGGTTSNTYGTSGNWINDHSNALVDWTDIDAAEQLFAAMTDQESGERIVCLPDTMLVMPYKKRTAMHILNATEISTSTASAAEIRRGPNADMNFKLLSSPILYQRATDATGLALAASAAREYWFLLEAQRAFGYMENWSMTVQSAGASDYQMLDYGLVTSVFADEMGIPTVLEPRYVVRNKD